MGLSVLRILRFGFRGWISGSGLSLRNHSVWDPFSCSSCKTAITQPFDFKTLARTVTAIEPSTPVPGPKQLDREKSRSAIPNSLLYKLSC